MGGPPRTLEFSSGPGSPGPSACLSASPHQCLVDVHVSHAALLFSRGFHLHILALPPRWLLCPLSFSSLHPPHPHHSCLSCLLLPRISKKSSREHGEKMPNERSAAVNGGSRKWPRWGKSEVQSRHHLPLWCLASCPRSNTYTS